jgi:hypothetical protein
MAVSLRSLFKKIRIDMSDEKEIKNDQKVKENEVNETKDTIEENEEPTAEQRYAELNDK